MSPPSRLLTRPRPPFAAGPGRAGAALLMILGLATAVSPAPDAARAAGRGPAVSDAARAKREQAVASVLRDLRARDDFPATEDAVQLALWEYARTGDRTSLERAGRLAARMTGGAGERTVVSALPLYLVAQADGAAFRAAEGERLLESTRVLLEAGPVRATTDSYARLVQDFFARAAVLGTPEAFAEALMAAESLFQARTRSSGTRVLVLPGGSEAAFTTLSDHLECLDVAVMGYEVSGSPSVLEFVSRLAHEMLQGFWNDGASRLAMMDREVVGLPPSAKPLLEARAALSLWRAGQATGEATLIGRAQRALDAVLAEALGTPESAAAAAFAAAVMTHPPVELVLVGEPGEPALIGMRHAAFGAFEPARVILNLDPSSDGDRLAELDCPAGDAPALYITVDARRSPAVKDPAEVPRALREMRDGAAAPERR